MNLDILNRAEGFCALQLWQQAWDAMEELPRHEKADPEVSVLRLRIVGELAMWEAGEDVADQVSGSPRAELKRTAAQYFLDRARKIHRDGRLAEARRNFRKALGAWRGITREFTERDLDGLGPMEEALESVASSGRSEESEANREGSFGARFRSVGARGVRRGPPPPGSLY